MSEKRGKHLDGKAIALILVSAIAFICLASIFGYVLYWLIGFFIDY